MERKESKLFLPDAKQALQLMEVAWKDFYEKAQAAGYGIDSDEVRGICNELFLAGYTYGWNDALNIIRGQMDAERLASNVMNGGTDYGLDTDVCRLPFSVRTINCLRSADINTLGDLLRVSKASLFMVYGFGKKCLLEIDGFYKANGYEWGAESLKWVWDDERRSMGHYYLPKKQ